MAATKADAPASNTKLVSAMYLLAFLRWRVYIYK